jgi:endo-1,4-beta-xylanase
MKWHGFVLAIGIVGFSGAAPEQSLREAAHSSVILIGAAVRPALLSEAAYADTLAREFNMVEPEDALKWEVVHPTEESYDFSQGDQVIDFAGRHGMKVRGHTLVWHRQNPKWLTEGRYSSAELAEILEKHIRTVVGHYRGRIFAWDVVNEAFDESRPGELRSTIWSDRPGIGLASRFERQDSSNQISPEPAARGSQRNYSYIERCFRWAHEADPQALLFYNDAEAEVVNPKSDAIYAMARDFRQRGVPIDGVGLQMHIAHLHTDVASISENIKRLTALGLQVHITEMDVALPVDGLGGARAGDLLRQAEIYREVVAACLSYAGCTAIQTWGFTDKYSWIGSHSRKTEGAALLFDRNYGGKPAYEALRNALERARSR